MNKNRMLTLSATALAVVLLVAGAYGVVSTTLMMPSTGGVTTLQMFSDPNLTNITTILSWPNNTAPNNNYTLVEYIRNNGGQPVNLTMTTTNWNPANATDYLSVTWDQQNYTLLSQASIKCTFTLTIYANATGTFLGMFSYETVITGNIWSS